jgi:hypothetical protein
MLPDSITGTITIDLYKVNDTRLVAGDWLLVTGIWLLVAGFWAMVTGCSILDPGYSIKSRPMAEDRGQKAEDPPSLCELRRGQQMAEASD